MKPAQSTQSSVSFRSLRALRPTCKRFPFWRLELVKTQEAKALSDQAVDLRVRQFTLYRNKDKLQVDTKEWKAFVSALELVNHFIDETVADIKVIKEAQDSAARLISVATKITATFAGKVA